AAGVGQGHAADDVGGVPAQWVHLEFDVFVGFGRHHLGADVLDELGGWEHVPVTGAEHTVLAFGGLAVGFGGVDRVGEFDAPVAGAGLLVVGASLLGHGLFGSPSFQLEGVVTAQLLFQDIAHGLGAFLRQALVVGVAAPAVGVTDDGEFEVVGVDVAFDGGRGLTHDLLGLLGEVGLVELEHHVGLQGDGLGVTVTGRGGCVGVDEAFESTVVLVPIRLGAAVLELDVVTGLGLGATLVHVGAVGVGGVGFFFVDVDDGDAGHGAEAAADEGDLFDLVGHAWGDRPVGRVVAGVQGKGGLATDRVDDRRGEAEVVVDAFEVVDVGGLVVHDDVVVGAFHVGDGKTQCGVLSGVLEDRSLPCVG